MSTVRPRVYLVAATAARFPPAGEAWSCWETDASDDASALVEFAGRLCYQSWEKPNPATRRNRDYIANILRQMHFSVLEHAGFTVAIAGVSRSFSHELVRHRHLSFSQLSQRFFNEAGASYIVPPLFRDDPDATAILQEVWEVTQDAYRRLVELGARRLDALGDRTLRRKRVREAARCVLPNMTETQIVVSGNHRAWREFLEKRATEHAGAEMREVALQIFHIARTLAPPIYQDFEAVEVPEGGRTITVLRRRVQEVNPNGE